MHVPSTITRKKVLAMDNVSPEIQNTELSNDGSVNGVSNVVSYAPCQFIKIEEYNFIQWVSDTSSIFR